jgi:hypothetical protein
MVTLYSPSSLSNLKCEGSIVQTRVNVYYSMSYPEASCLWTSPDFTHKY